MAIINYNLKQITNYTIKEMQNVGIETINNQEYYILTNIHFGGTPILKMSYICEPNAFSIPIYIAFEGKESKITLGKTGIFEIQPEKFIDKNNGDKETNIKFNITALKIPVNYSFSIDYITATEV